MKILRPLKHNGWTKTIKKKNSGVFLDIDECDTEEHSCSADAVCNNTRGLYNCDCKPGYSGDGRTCQGEFSDIPSHNP